MKTRLLRIWSLTMVLVIAASTAGFSINRHYCGGKEKSKAFILEADKCAFESKSICIKHESTTLKKKACCSDHSDFYKQHIQVDFEYESIQLNNGIQAVQVDNPLIVNLDIDQSVTLVPVYRPPPPKNPLFILHQSFLL